MRRLSKIGALFALVALHCALLALSITPWHPTDDAYISYRYAANWADGHGPVFNLGERVEGYSNFLFVAVVAMADRVGITPPLAGRLLNAASVCVVASLLLFALPGKLGKSPARYFAALIFVASYLTTVNTLSGLEAPFFAMWLLGGALALEHRRRAPAALCFLALALTRPEGAALAGVAAAVALARGVKEGGSRRVVLAWGLGFALPFAAYHLWRIAFYGQLIPNSIVAKMGRETLDGVRSSLRYMAPALESHWPLLTLLGAAGLIACVRRRSWHLGPSVPWAVSLLAAVVIALTVRTGAGDPYLPFLRYLFPALPLLLVMGVSAAERLRAGAATGRGRWLVDVALLGLFVAQLTVAAGPGGLAGPWRGGVERAGQGVPLVFGQDRVPHDDDAAGIPLGLHSVAAWLKDNAQPHELLATAEVGIGPYYSGVQVVDTFGLVTEHIAGRPGVPGAKGDPNYVFGRSPDYFVFKKRKDCLCSGIPADVELFRDSRFLRHYELARSFSDHALTILVFRRRQQDVTPSVLDLCSGVTVPNVVLRRPNGRVAEKVPPRLRRLASLGYVDLFDAQRRDELYERMKPTVVAGIPGPRDRELMDEWRSRWACYSRQLPVDAGRRDVAVVHDVEVPRDGVLTFLYGLPQDPRTVSSSSELRFEIRVRDRDGEVHQVFTETLSTDRAPVWLPAAVPLGDFAGQKVRLLLRIHQDMPDGRLVYNSGWLDLQLASHRPPAEEVAF